MCSSWRWSEQGRIKKCKKIVSETDNDMIATYSEKRIAKLTGCCYHITKIVQNCSGASTKIQNSWFFGPKFHISFAILFSLFNILDWRLAHWDRYGSRSSMVHSPPSTTFGRKPDKLQMKLYHSLIFIYLKARKHRTMFTCKRFQKETDSGSCYQ